MPSSLVTASLDVVNTGHGTRPATYTVPCGADACAPAQDAAYAQHAQHAATCAATALAPNALVLARVLGGGTELELRVVCDGNEDSAPPTSFRLPAPVLASIGVFEEGSIIHVLAVTSTAYVYRLAIPFATILRGAPLPHGWSSEQHIATLTGAEASAPTHVHAVDGGALLIACAGGEIVQLRQAHAGVDGIGYMGPWHESVMRPASLFSVSRLFSRSRANYALDIATHVRANDPALAFTVCADRRLRVWNLVTESCVRTLDLPSTLVAVESAARGNPQNDAGHDFGRSMPFVRVFHPAADAPFSLYVLVFVPAPPPYGSFIVAYGVELEDSESWSGGVGEMSLVWGTACHSSAQALDIELHDMALVHDGATWNAWLLWHTGGGTLLQHTPVLDVRHAEDKALALGSGDNAWETTTAPSPYLALRGPEFDAALSSLRSTHDVAQFFVERLVEPGRFSTSSLRYAFAALVPKVPVPPSRTGLVSALIAHIDRTHGLRQDSVSGALLYEQLFEDTVDAWQAYVRLAEQHEASARLPLCLAAVGPLVVISRDALGVLVTRDLPTSIGVCASKYASATLDPDGASTAIAGVIAAEFSQVLRALSAVPMPKPAFHVSGVQRFRLVSVAMQMYIELGPNGQSRLENALLRLGGGPAVPHLAGIVEGVPLHKLQEHINWAGADKVLDHYGTLVNIFVDAKLERTGAFVPSAFTIAAGAEAAAHGALARLAAIRALIVLGTALTLHSAEVPVEIERALNRLLDAWRRARAFSQLVCLGAESVDGSTPVVNLLHALTLHGDIRCSLVPSGAAFDQVLDIPSLGALAGALISCGYSCAVLAYFASLETSPAITYIRAECLVRVGRVREAWRLYEHVSAMLTAKDEALLEVLPEHIHGVHTLWTHAAALFEAAGDVSGAAGAYARALEAPTADTRETWTRLFRAQLALGEFERAARTVLAMPHDDVQTACLQSLVTALCEADAVPTLLRLHFGELQPAAERALSFKARNAEPLSRPNYFAALYSYHVSHGDYKSAAATMYQHSRRLRTATFAVPVGDALAAELAVQQAHALLASINALAMLAPANAWFAHAVGDEPVGAGLPASAPVKRALSGHLPQYIPGDLFGPAAHPLVILQFADIRREYDELLMRLELVHSYPELTSPAHILKPDDAVHLFLATDDFDGAFRCATALGVDASDAFAELAGKCVVLELHHNARVARLDPSGDNPDAALRQLVLDDEEAADPDAAFLVRSRAVAWPGNSHERAWRLLRLYLDAQESVAWCRCATAAVERVLSLDATLLPSWLYDACRVREPASLVRAYMRNGIMDRAITLSVTLVRDATSDTRTRQTQPRASLPYTLFDSLITAADRAGNSELGTPLKDALSERVRVLERTHARTVAPGMTSDDAPPTEALLV